MNGTEVQALATAGIGNAAFTDKLLIWSKNLENCRNKETIPQG
jgi:hypothetical protein